MKFDEKLYLILNEDSMDYFIDEYVYSKEIHRELDLKLSKILDDYGIPNYYSGYSYLKDAIILAKINNNCQSYLTKYIYPEISKKYNTNIMCVEHAIRHAIKASYSNGSMGDRYTNCQFIYKIANSI
jgi:two-component system response regulator (stage 0 sporulation protein A)